MSYPPPVLRSYQFDAVEAIFKEWESHHSTMAVMATGTGKTVTFCEVIRRLHPQRCIIIAHRTELIQQACAALSKIGIRSEIEMAEHKADASMFYGDSVIVASVQSLISGRKDAKRMEKFRPQDFACLIIDECFPAGTLVDGRPIETVQVGDTAKTHLGNGVVTHVFKKKAHALIRLYLENGSTLTCTPDHPIWTLDGWTSAIDLTLGTMMLTIMPDEKVHYLSVTDREKALQETGMQIRALKKNHREVLQEAWWRDNEVSENERHEQSRDSGACFVEAPRDGLEANCEDGQRNWPDDSATGIGGSIGMGYGGCHSYQEKQSFRLSDLLQSGCWELRLKSSNRNRRRISPSFIKERAGQKEGRTAALIRLAGVEILQRGGDGEFEKVCPDGFVYNLEVSNGNTYFANGILVHNCHHSVARSYRDVIAHFRQNQNLKILGVSATPDRSDEKAMGLVYESVAFKFDIADAIEDGWLVPIEQQLVRIASLDYSHVRTTAGDLNGADLAKIMEDEKNLQGMVGASIEIIGNRKSIAFTSSVRHAEMCCDIFNRHRPGMADWICGETSDDDRARILRRFKAGEVQVLCNVSVAVEGFDVPDVEVVIMGRPTKSRSLYTQAVGRCTRPLPGAIDGLNSSYERREAIAESAKPAGLVLDFVGNSGKHKLMTTADILGGDYTEEEKEEALKEIESSGKPKRISDAIKEIRERIEKQKAAEAARKARLVAKVQYSSKPVSPFDAFDIKPRQDSKWDTGKPLSEKQRAVLQKMGVNPDEINYAAAKQLLHLSFKRREKGLCTIAQAQVLKKHGYEPKKMTFSDASRIIDSLKKNNWQRADLALT